MSLLLLLVVSQNIMLGWRLQAGSLHPTQWAVAEWLHTEYRQDTRHSSSSSSSSSSNGSSNQCQRATM
jgi:hypothetical protein